jgi:hypothetical protein
MKRRLQLASPSNRSTAPPPLAQVARAVDRMTRPIYAVWELTLR